MSRFSRSVGPEFRIWSPPESPVRIEYSASLFREIRLEGADGDLYGIALQESIRIVAGGAVSAKTGRFQRVGIFAIRPRGEVFLTEKDLERFETSGARVALVVAGSNAGFFVRQLDGSIQSIRSHQEVAAPTPPVEAKPLSSQHRWTWLPITALAIVAIALAAIWFSRKPPPALSVHQDGAQLRIAWTPVRGTIEITDGEVRGAIPVTSDISRIAYVARTADVQIRLIAGTRVQTRRFVGPDPVAPELERVRQEIAAFEVQANTLAAESARQKLRAAALQKTLSTMKRAD